MPEQSKISFNCDACGKAYRVPVSLAGRSAKCKGCGAKMRVPNPTDDANDDEVFSIDELKAMGETARAQSSPSPDEVPADEVFSMEDLAQFADYPALGKQSNTPVVSSSTADVAFNPLVSFPSVNRRTSRRHLFVASIAGGAIALLAITVALTVVVSGNDKSGISKTEEAGRKGLSLNKPVESDPGGRQLTPDRWRSKMARPKTYIRGNTRTTVTVIEGPNGGRGIRIVQDVTGPRVALFAPEQLPLVNPDKAPGPGQTWPVFTSPPQIDMSAADEVHFQGYQISLLPGYRVEGMSVDDDGNASLKISVPLSYDEYGSTTGQRYTALYISLRPQARADDGTPIIKTWQQLLEEERLTHAHYFTEYGQINRIPFVRASPSQALREHSTWGITYLSRSPNSAQRVEMEIWTRDPEGGPDTLDLDEALRLEAIARSLKKSELAGASDYYQVPDTAPSALLDAPEGQGQKRRWRKQGLFHYLNHDKVQASVIRADRHEFDLQQHFMETNYSGFHWINMTAAEPDETREIRVDLDGPIPLKDDSGFRGKTVYAFRGAVSVKKMWGDGIFVRVDHGVTTVRQGRAFQQVSYYGWLGDFWCEVRMVVGPESHLGLQGTERLFRQMRLIHPLVMQSDELASSHWIKLMLSHEHADVPLAGGLTLRESFDIDAYGRVVFAEKIAPKNLIPLPPEPVLPALVNDETLASFEQWDIAPDMAEYLGRSEQAGLVEIKPIEDLKRSEKSTDQHVEWFTNTRAGRITIDLRVDRIEADQTPPLIPIQADAETGKTIIYLGRRRLRTSTPPEVTHRRVNGMRVWRLLMPRIDGHPLRRCYYVTSVPGQAMCFTVDFEADKPDQLAAIDASIASMQYNAGYSQRDRFQAENKRRQQERDRIDEYWPE